MNLSDFKSILELFDLGKRKAKVVFRWTGASFSNALLLTVLSSALVLPLLLAVLYVLQIQLTQDTAEDIRATRQIDSYLVQRKLQDELELCIQSKFDNHKHKDRFCNTAEATYRTSSSSLDKDYLLKNQIFEEMLIEANAAARNLEYTANLSHDFTPTLAQKMAELLNSEYGLLAMKAFMVLFSTWALIVFFVRFVISSLNFLKEKFLDMLSNKLFGPSK
ncbi:hypothetical protein ACPV5Q_10180 [Vibrio astriarenae]